MPFSPQTTEIRLNNLEEQKTMTKAQHTPGPWVVRGDKKVVSQAKGWSGLEVANCMTYDASIAQRQANARLISAAPELLEALRNVCNGLYALRDHAQQEYGVAASIEQRLINECITAIAKAEGGAE